MIDAPPSLVGRVRWYHWAMPIALLYAGPFIIELAREGWLGYRYGDHTGAFASYLAGLDVPGSLAVNYVPICAAAVLAFRYLCHAGDPALMVRFRPILPRDAIACGLGGTLLMVCYVAGLYWLDRLLHLELISRVSMPMPDDVLWRFVVAANMLAYPVIMTVCFYGLMLAWLEQRWGVKAAVIAFAVLIGVMSGQYLWFDIAGYLLTLLFMICGLVVALIAIRTRTLWGPLIIHVCGAVVSLAWAFRDSFT